MRASSVILLLSLIGCSATAISQEPKIRSSWLTESTMERISPATVRPGDLTATWKGVDGRPVQVVVSAPRAASGTRIELSPLPGDNAPALLAGLARLRKAGGGELHLAPGIYRLAGDKGSKEPLLSIERQKDVTISGKGATFMLMRWGTGISIRNSERIRLVDLSISYAAPALVTGSVVQDAAGIALAIDPGKLPGSGPFAIHQITTRNPKGPGYAIHGTRLILGKEGTIFKPTPSGNYTSSDKLAGFHPGDRVAIKLTYYDGATITVDDHADAPPSNDITIDHLTIGNSSGMAITAEHMGRGLAIVNSHLGPAMPDDDPSIPFDGIHVSAAGGDILIRDNQISGTADDGINLASPILDVVGPSSAGTVRIRNAGAITRGETIALFDDQLRYLGQGVATGRDPIGSDGSSAVHLSGIIPNVEQSRYAREGSFLGTRYAIIGNSIANCECHGLLAQGPNGLISKNTFSGLRYNAIRLLTSGMWKEGSGAANVVVVDNVIHDTGAETKRGFVWGAITAYGEIGNPDGKFPQMTPFPVNDGLLISGNTVTNTQDVCISIADTEDASLTHNQCDQTMLGGPPHTGTFSSSSGSDATRSAGIWIDPKTTTNVSFDIPRQ
jgi:hypothetical protein